MGTWLVRGGPMANPTGDTDLTNPDFADVLGANKLGTVEIPIDDVASAFVYLDGSGTPVTIAGLPSGFTPDDAFTMHHVPAAVDVSDTVRTVIAGLVDVLLAGPGLGSTPPFYTDTALTGMTLAKFTALLGSHALVTLDTAAGGVAEAGEQSNSAYDASFTFNLNGTYTTTPPSVDSVTPPSGSVAGGQAVTIRGVGFTGALGALFGGAAVTAWVVVDDTTATAVTPAHLSGLVDVEVLGVATGTGLYTYGVETRKVPPMPDRTPIRQGDDPKYASRGAGRRG